MLSCSLVFIGINKKGFPGIALLYWNADPRPSTISIFVILQPFSSCWFSWIPWFQKISLDIHTGPVVPATKPPPPRRWRLSISLRFAITLGRLRVMYLGSRLENAGRGVWKWKEPTTIVGTPWKPNEHHHCEPFMILRSLLSPKKKCAEFSGLATCAFRHSALL